MRRSFGFLVGFGIVAALAVPVRLAGAEPVSVVAVAETANETSAGKAGTGSQGRDSSAAAAAKVQPVPRPAPRRAQVAHAPEKRLVADSVLVVKSERRLYLMQRGQAIRTYDVALGFNPAGHKIHEGDGRTPEGFYTLGEALPESRFYRALPISYPAPEDVERARARGFSPGGRIMIHGLPPSGARMGRQHLYLDWTDGCVAVTNEEIDEIAQAVRPGTPIEIRP